MNRAAPEDVWEMDTLAHGKSVADWGVSRSLSATRRSIRVTAGAGSVKEPNKGVDGITASVGYM